MEDIYLFDTIVSYPIQNVPLVSVVMAVKDTEPYLPACLESIRAQTYPHWELVAVNDHSEDNSLSILQYFALKDPRIRVFESDIPRLIPTLQVAYREVRGDLINRMDSDDLMPADKLEVLVSEWRKYGRGTVIAGGTKHFVSQGKVGGGFLRYERWLNDVARHQRHFQEIYRECVIPSHSWIIHRQDLDAVGAFDPVVYPEDYDLCFRFYKAGLRIVGIDKILHFWRDRSDRISRTWKEYKDNRYFTLKLKYFYELDRDRARPLVLWGAGRNGKDLASLLKEREDPFHWVCENEKKTGREIYGINLQEIEVIPQLNRPQIMVAVTSPREVVKINQQLKSWGKMPVKDYWFFI